MLDIVIDKAGAKTIHVSGAILPPIFRRGVVPGNVFLNFFRFLDDFHDIYHYGNEGEEKYGAKSDCEKEEGTIDVYEARGVLENTDGHNAESDQDYHKVDDGRNKFIFHAEIITHDGIE